MIRVRWAEPLAVACRDWLLELARKEAEAGCPRLLRMKGDVEMYFADAAKDWSSEQRSHLLTGGVKALFNKNYGCARSEMTEEENAAKSHWDYPFWYTNREGLGPFRTPGRATTEIVRANGRKFVVDVDKVGAFLRRERSDLGGYKIDKKVLKGAVRSAMVPLFGKPEVFGPLWQFRTDVGGLTVTNAIDFGGRRPSQMRYEQWIHIIDGPTRTWLLAHGGLSALLAWPQTEWRYLTNDDIPEAAELLVQLCTDFVEGVPGMWERSGLTGAEGAPS